MSIRRAVPDIRSRSIEESREFYVDFLGFEVAMDLGFVMTFASPRNPTAQITVMQDDGQQTLWPDVSIEVDDVDAVHQRAVERGFAIVYPLTDEPWGVRRFFVRDPNGATLNILSHRVGAASPAARTPSAPNET
jgi:catechol 2,3-dioxygenase-like lactoylglutathione lyase family enzyme